MNSRNDPDRRRQADKAGARDWAEGDREKHAIRPGFKRNKGEQPRGTRGKRVEVALMTGRLAGEVSAAAAGGSSWPADQSRWSLTGSKFDIDQFKLV